jgi:hypothetical protein
MENSIKKLLRLTIQNKSHGMLTASAMHLHDNACPHSAACTGALLEHFNWELFDHPQYSPDLTANNCHLFVYLKNWLGSQHFSNNEKLMECVKTWLSPQISLTEPYKNLFPDMSDASILAVTTLRSSLNMYVIVYIIFFSNSLF